ncbi:MAG: hypothetical protein IJ569_06140 [Prevotella sp.]|nr:hypothetical protein [Prevotella sp.]
MKKVLVISVGAMLLLSSCGTYTGEGAFVGGQFGSVIGSAIGGIAGGWRGSDIGTLVGMAGGAVVGAAIGSAADQAEQKKYEDYKAQRNRVLQSQRQERRYEQDNRSYSNDYNADDSGYDATNSGDDRLYGFGEDFSTPPAAPADALQSLEIRNPRIVDASRNGVLVRGEEARMIFEVYNNSSKPVYRVLPTVTEMTGNKHIHVSQNVMVESIMPGKGIRYTASIKADNGLREGEAVFRIGVSLSGREVGSQVKTFPIKTSKR